VKNDYVRELIWGKVVFGFRLPGCFQSDSNHRNSNIREIWGKVLPFGIRIIDQTFLLMGGDAIFHHPGNPTCIDYINRAFRAEFDTWSWPSANGD